MHRNKMNINQLRRIYIRNSQSGLIMALFSGAFSLIFLYFGIKAFYFGSGLIAIFPLLLGLLLAAIFCVIIRQSIDEFLHGKKNFAKKISAEAAAQIDQELQSEESLYLEELCIGQELMIQLNPEPYDAIYLKQKDIQKLTIGKVQTGTKYRYWVNKITIIGFGTFMKVAMISDERVKELLQYVADELPNITILDQRQQKKE